MPRRLRRQRFAWEPFEITTRCHQARYLLRAGTEANKRVLGVLGRGLELYGEHVRLHFAASENNHVHLYLAARSPVWRARFKCHFKTNVSKELGQLHDWPNGLWERRTSDIPVEEDAVESRLRYYAAHGVKSGIAKTPLAWPGIQWVRAVTEGTPLRGVWYNRTRLRKLRDAWARQPKDERGRKPGLGAVSTHYTLELTPLPHIAHLSKKAQREYWQQLVAEALVAHPCPTDTPMTAEQVLALDPHTRPASYKRTPAPFIHTHDPEVRATYRKEQRIFEATYRAANALRAQGEPAELPEGACWPAGLPLLEEHQVHPTEA